LKASDLSNPDGFLAGKIPKKWRPLFSIAMEQPVDPDETIFSLTVCYASAGPWQN
jgi:hypothetical protein